MHMHEEEKRKLLEMLASPDGLQVGRIRIDVAGLCDTCGGSDTSEGCNIIDLYLFWQRYKNKYVRDEDGAVLCTQCGTALN